MADEYKNLMRHGSIVDLREYRRTLAFLEQFIEACPTESMIVERRDLKYRIEDVENRMIALEFVEPLQD